VNSSTFSLREVAQGQPYLARLAEVPLLAEDLGQLAETLERQLEVEVQSRVAGLAAGLGCGLYRGTSNPVVFSPLLPTLPINIALP
jgi:hypothetical protein